MGFRSSLKGLFKHEPVVTTSPTIEPIQTPDSRPQPEQKMQQNTPVQTRVTTQRPAPVTPSPRAHA